MQLCTVIAKNFRAFRHAEISFPEHGLVLVAGANNTGKTALLSALDVIAGDSGDVTSLRHAGGDGPPEVVARFCLSEAERIDLLGGVPKGERFLAEGELARLEFLFSEDQVLRRSGQSGLGLVEIRNNWPPYEASTLFRLDLNSNGGIQVQMLSALISEGNPPGMSARGYAGQPDWLDKVLRSTPDLVSFGSLLATWQSRFYHFRALRPGAPRVQALASSDKLEPTGGNLSAVLLNLATDHTDLFDQLRVLIAEIVPQIGRLGVRTRDNQLRVVFENARGDLNLKDLGTGVEQLLMTLVVGLMEAPPFTLVVEEPETNLHPAGQRALLGHFQGWAEDRQIIAATHSPVMLNWSPGGDRLWHVTRNGDDSDVAMVDADPLPLLSSLGVQLSDILSADRILVLEGPSDQDVLVVWFPEVLRSPRVAVLDGRGGDNARHADRLAEWLAGADRIGLRKVLYLRDRDELSTEAFNKLSNSPLVQILPRRELENFLLEPAAIAAVFGSLDLQGNDSPTAEDVDAVISEAAEGLRRKIIVNRVCRQIGPSQPLVGHKLRQELASAGADMEQIATTVLDRMMTRDDLRTQIAMAWAEAEQDVASHEGARLLTIAPGEEILSAIFERFADRKYDKRRDGPVIAKAIRPPAEIGKVLADFMAD